MHITTILFVALQTISISLCLRRVYHHVRFERAKRRVEILNEQRDRFRNTLDELKKTMGELLAVTEEIRKQEGEEKLEKPAADPEKIVSVNDATTQAVAPTI